MKKGCLGCIGCGCLIVILSILIPSIWAYNWATTDGRKLLAEGIQQITVESCKLAFEPESASEIASLTKEIKDDVVNGNIGIIDSWNYFLSNMQNNQKLQGQVLFAVLFRELKGKIKDKDNKVILLDDEGAEAVRTIMYAMNQNKIDLDSTISKLAPLLDNKNNINIKSGNNKYESKKYKNNITKEDMEAVVKGLKEYVKNNKLEKPENDITPDSLAKEEIIKFLNGMKKLKK